MIAEAGELAPRTALEQAFWYGMAEGSLVRERLEERATEVELEHLRHTAEYQTADNRRSVSQGGPGS